MEIVLPFSHPIWDATWPPALQTKRQQWWDELGRWIWHAGRWTLKRPANRLQPWTVLTPDEEYALEHWEALRIPPPEPFALPYTRDTVPYQICTETEWPLVLKFLATFPVVGFDVETNGLDPRVHQVMLIQCAAYDPASQDWYVYIAPVKDWRGDWHTPLQTWMTQTCLVGHNLKFDLQMLHMAEVFPRGWDTMIAEQVQSPGDLQRYALPALVQHYLHQDMSKVEQTSDWSADTLTADQWRYAAWDPVTTLAIASHQWHHMYGHGLERVMSLEMAVVPVVAQMERRGISIDRTEIIHQQTQTATYKDMAQRGVEQAWHIPEDLFQGPLVNIQSEKQLLQHLHQWGFPIPDTSSETLAQWEIWAAAKLGKILSPAALQEWMIHWTQSLQELEAPTQTLHAIWSGGEGTTLSSPSTKSPDRPIWEALPAVAEKLKGFIVGCEYLMLFRQYKKWEEKWAELDLYSKGGTLYSRFLQCVPKGTGRMAASKPNPLNIPKDLRFRAVFTARPGYRLLLADYPSIELKILAWLAGENVLYQLFTQDGDPHAEMGAEVYQKPPALVTKAERAVGKTCNFGFGYGMGDTTFVRHNQHPLFLAGINIQTTDGNRFWSAFHRHYPAIDRWHHTQYQHAKKTHQVESLLGRPRRWGQTVSFNESLNTPSQGTGADMLKIALGLTARRLAPYGGSVLLAVHDELICEIPAEHAEIGRQILQTSMEEAATLLHPIPVQVEAVIAKSWAEKA